ncbi:hypothetical protein DPMN_055050 [Dreissena polymorpha]|uniref:BED-type domain-containing protein n=1 Tax=Dreissena polymorpha TaxID=45954 RepID=A0A9D4HQB4_DREPO|nr:hypothetical protein DPMN_055050 [Dreissena polymorpha]
MSMPRIVLNIRRASAQSARGNFPAVSSSTFMFRDMANETGRGKKSPYWNFFLIKIEVCGKEKVKCNLCAAELAFKGGSTGTMANHIKLVHKSVRLDATKTSADDSEKQQRKLTDYAQPTMSRQKWIVCTEKKALMCAQDLRPNFHCKLRRFH